ncbi:hypothetical protein K6W37_09445 [Acetobacter senegalensis]|uniref:hypothetical protein n=1 Tax=Acetobacter senegalensis TaxID=446692 RepID=UPI001EDA7A33|nr:hypothetical protein [Acetobacter senegalensis]MCG4254112.1 hypothetical protein [Acetobacter senegalensis]
MTIDINFEYRNALNINDRAARRVMRSSRALIYNSGDGNIWGTWRGGTCFIIRWIDNSKKRYFCICAKHTLKNMMNGELTSDNVHNIYVLKGNKFSPNERLDDRHWVQVVAYHPLQDPKWLEEHTDEPDASDFVILETRPYSFDGISDVFTVYPKKLGKPNDHFVSVNDGQLSSILVTSGFPTINNTIDYDEERIIIQREILYGLNSEKNKSLYIGQIDFNKSTNLPKDFDGLSGSPVFSFHKNRWKLAGMVIRGTATSKKLYFLKINIIGLALYISAITSSKIMRDFFRKTQPRKIPKKNNQIRNRRIA